MEKWGGMAQNQCIEHILFLLCNSGTCQVGGVVSKLETCFVLMMSQGWSRVSLSTVLQSALGPPYILHISDFLL